MSNESVFRLRWFDAQPESQATPVLWPDAALITATLFLNFAWYGFGGPFPVGGTFSRSAAVYGAVALLVAALFFAGPALASQAAGRPLFDVIERSLGSAPTWGVRLCSTWFLVIWLAGMVSWPATRFLGVPLRDPSTPEISVIAAALLIFLFLTALRTVRTSAALALFSNQVSCAVLAAALIRVRTGLPTALNDFGPVELPAAWHNLSLLALWAGPLLFLAADLGHRLRRPMPVAMTAAMGVVLPLFATLFVSAVIGSATHASRYYQPSLQPTVAMALWSKVAGLALPGPMMIAAITVFSAVRFGLRALANSLAAPAFGRSLWGAPLACVAALVA